jgi:hypothetical protein
LTMRTPLRLVIASAHLVGRGAYVAALLLMLVPSPPSATPAGETQWASPEAIILSEIILLLVCLRSLSESTQRIGQPAVMDPAKRRHPARTVGVGRSLARPAAAALPAEPRAGGHDRRRLPAGHSDAPASDRDGDRLVCGQAVGSGRDQRFDCGHKPELCVRLRARRAVAGYAWSSAQWA